MTKLNAEQSKFLTRIMTMGSGTSLPVTMTPGELAKLIGVIYFDTGRHDELEIKHPRLWQKINPKAGYYEKSLDWFEGDIDIDAPQHVEIMKFAETQISDFSTYLLCLSELHKRRRKYARILSTQPMPTMVQVSPRSLVEYGTLEPVALASWLMWRKFFYDLDNRSAQETGYLFEPILAAAIGGEAKSARTKIVTRTDDPTKGRQVDCWKILPDGRKLAYEFKLRVTIAASGQGRFSEEVQFAEDVFNSGAIPILVVLDPTMNPKLAELQQAYETKGGRAYLGPDAWKHLEDEAGETMAKFIKRYVQLPIERVSQFELKSNESGETEQTTLLDFNASRINDQIIFKIGNHSLAIPRRENHNLVSDDMDDE